MFQELRLFFIYNNTFYIYTNNGDNMNDENIYLVKNKNNYILKYPKYNIETIAYIGKNGLTKNKIEGDYKTPIGIFDLGIKMSMTEKKGCILINEYMYWISDSNSKYYNELVNIKEVEKDWENAEHLIDYKIQYEFLIEIKANPNNKKNKGSAIFLHCKNKDYTAGCIAIDRTVMEKLVGLVNKDTKIIISN